MTAIFEKVGSSKVEAFKIIDAMTKEETKKLYEALVFVEAYFELDMRTEWYRTQLGHKVRGEA